VPSPPHRPGADVVEGAGGRPYPCGALRHQVRERSLLRQKPRHGDAHSLGGYVQKVSPPLRKFDAILTFRNAFSNSSHSMLLGCNSR
jgi:hypothetical protein